MLDNTVPVKAPIANPVPAFFNTGTASLNPALAFSHPLPIAVPALLPFSSFLPNKKFLKVSLFFKIPIPAPRIAPPRIPPGRICIPNTPRPVLNPKAPLIIELIPPTTAPPTIAGANFLKCALVFSLINPP